MATPYRQHRIDTATSTQDVARDLFDEVPALVIASAQTAGRGRSGSGWETAPRALAVSLAVGVGSDDHRPFSLIAGVAAARSTRGTRLKWPNDLIISEEKVGGILVERSDDLVVIGLGVNLWWPEPPQDFTALFVEDPGPELHAEIGALWGAELIRLIEADRWPIDEYREVCTTLGRELTWDPDGSGKAIDIADDGGLVVETSNGMETLYSGAIRHLMSPRFRVDRSPEG